MMTRNRAQVYRRKWFTRECKIDQKKRKREYNRKIRHMKITEDSCDKGLIKSKRNLCWNTVS